MKIIIKKAVLSDCQKICELSHQLLKKEKIDYDQTINPRWSLTKSSFEYFGGLISGPNGCVFAAWDGKKIVGYLGGALIDEDIFEHRKVKKMAELENMIVLDGYRGKKIGQRLIKEFFSWCREQGVDRAKVVASFGNDGAMNFYRRNGFVDRSMIFEKKIAR